MLQQGVCLIVLVFLCVDVAYSIHASTWDVCGCHWATWKAWSECNSDCFGRRVRTREVWSHNTNQCSEFTDCASGDEGSDWQNCNEVCHNGGHVINLFYKRCQCLPGYYSSCCSDRVNCGTPDKILNGSKTVSSTYYGGKATYTCDKYYNMTSGDPVRTCQDNFSWSGNTPTCVFAYHCNSSPCKNGATCVNLLDDFRCDCMEGWGGQLCDQDIQPPVVTNCRADIEINATDITTQFSWNPPEFNDPMGMKLAIESNYPVPSFNFPWGDHIVQYVATKPSNGMSTECVFKVKVRPTPCEELNIPKNGARVCNGWKTDYGRFCMATCQQNYTLGRGRSFSTMYVCGASGTWIASSPMPDCVEVDSTSTALKYQPDYATFTFDEDCRSDVTTLRLQNLYLERLQSPSGFSTFCSKFRDECIAENVDIQCAS